ncbi:hypothetical protein D3C83_33720 [compost metagenome]
MDHAQLAGERETDRRPLGLQQQFLELAPDALGRQIVEPDRRTDARRFGLDAQIETSGELERAQHTERVVGKGCRIDNAQEPLLQILATMKRIEIFIGERIPSDRVDGEVAAPRRVFERHR